MPIARFQMPDGRVGRFEVPEGTSPEDAQAQIQAQFGEQQQPQAQAPAPQESGVNSDLWAKLEKQESGGNQSAVSPKGAIGVAQVMPGTAPEAAELAGLPFDEARYKGDADYNRKLGQAYMGKQLKDFGDERKALAAYNAGPGATRNALAKAQQEGRPDDWLSYLPDETQNYVRKIAGPASLKEGIVADIKEGGRIAASGIKQGLGAVPKMLIGGLQSAAQWGRVGAYQLGLESPDIPGLSGALDTAEDFLFKPRDYEVPETEVGKGASRIIGSTIAGAVSPGSLVPNLLAGASAGIASEIGGELAGEEGAVAGGIIGSVAPAIMSKGASLVGTPLKTKEKLARMGLENVDDLQLAIAKERMIAARQEGVQLTLPQAMPKETNLDQLQDTLVRMKAGEPLAAQLRDQPADIAAASQRAAATLPGQVKGSQEVANQAQEASTDALKQLRAERTAAVTPAYQSSGKISIDDVGPMYSSLKQAAKAGGSTNRAKTLKSIYDKLNPLKKVQQADGSTKIVRKPVTDVQLIDDTLREFEKKMSLKPKDPRAAALIQVEIGKIRDTLGNLSPGYKQGAQEYAQITKDIINPAKQGPLGQVAGRTGYSPDTPASRTNLYGVFDRGEGVLTLQKDMAKAGPDGKKAFVDAGTSWFADGINKSIKLEGGEVAPDIAKVLEQNFFGSPSQTQRTRDVLAGIARAQGVPEDQFVKGLENWAQTIKSAAKRPSSTRGQSGSEIKQATETLASKVASTTVLAPHRRMLEKVDELINKDAYTYVAKLMQSPEGIETLKTLAKAKPGTFTSETAIARFNATIAAQQAREEE